MAQEPQCRSIVRRHSSFAVAAFLATALFAGAASAATKHWIGNGVYPARLVQALGICYGFFDDPGCWSTAQGGGNNTTAPTTADTAQFNAGGLGSCTIQPFVGGAQSAGAISLIAGYTGTVSVTDQAGANPDLTTTGAISVAGGTMSLNGSQVTGGTTLSVTAGIFNAGSGTFSVAGTTTIRGAAAVFNSGTGSLTLSGTTIVDHGGTFNEGTGSVSFGSLLTVGAAATSGTFNTAAGTLTFGAGITLTNGSLNLSVPTSVTVTAGNVTVSVGTLTMGGTVTFPGSLGVRGASAIVVGGGTTTVTGTTTIDQGGTFNANSSSTTFNGLLTIGAAATVGTFNTGTSNLTFKGGITLTNGNLDLSGAASASAPAGNVTISTGTLTLGVAPFSFPAALTVRGATAIYQAGSATTTFTGNVVIDTGGTFNATSGTKNFTGQLVVGASATVGTFNAGTATINLNAAAQNTVQGAGTTFHAGSSHITTVSSFVVQTSGIFYAEACTLSVGTTCTVQTSGTLDTTTGSSGSTLGFTGTCSATTSGVIDFTGAAATTFTGSLGANVGGTVTMGPAAIIGTSMGSRGAGAIFNGGPNNLTVTTTTNIDQGGVFNAGSGLKTFTGAVTVGAATPTTGTFNVGTATFSFGALTVVDATVDFTGVASTLISGAVAVNAAGTLTMGPTTTIGGALTVRGASAVLNAGSNAQFVMGATTIDQGGAYNAGSGLKTFVGTVTVGAATPTVGTFNVGTASFSLGALTVVDATVDFTGLSAAGVSGAVNVNAAGTLTMGPSTTMASLVVRGASAVFNSGPNAQSVTAATTIDQGGIFNAGAGMKTLGGTVTVGAAATVGTFHAGTATISMSGALNQTNGTLYAESGSVTVGLAATLATSSVLDTTTGGSGSTVRFSGSLGVTASTVDLSGAATTSFTTSVSANAGATITMGPSTTIGTTLLVRGAGAIFNASNNSLTVTNGTTIDQGGAFRANAGTINFAGACTVGAAATVGTFTLGAANLTFGTSLTMTNTTIDLSTATATIFTGSVAVNASSTLTMGPATTIGTTLTVSGASAIFNASSNALSVLGNTSVNTGGVFNANACSNLQLSSGVNAVTIGSGGGTGTFNANTATITFNGNAGNSLLIQNAGAFTTGAANLTFGAGLITPGNWSVNVSAGTLDLTNAASYNFSPSGGVGGINVGATSTFTLGTGTAAFPRTLQVSGIFYARGTMSVASTTTVGAATSDFEGQTANITFTGAVTNSAGKLFLASAGLTFSSSLTVSGGTTTLGSQTVTFTALTVNTSGQFKAGTANVTVSGAVSVSSGSADFSSTTTGPTFGNSVTVSGGSLTLGSGTVGITVNLSVPGGTFNCNAAAVTVTGTTGVSGGTGTLNAGSNSLTLNNNLVLGAGGPLAGFFNANTAMISGKALFLQDGSTFDGGSGTNTMTFTTLTLGNGALPASTLNGGSRSAAVTFSGAATINASSTFDAKTAGNLNFSSTLAVGSVSAGAFSANAATITFAGTVTVALASTFDGGTSPSLRFTAVNALTLGNATPTTGTFTANASSETFSGQVQILGGSSFSANTSPSLTFNGAVVIGTVGGGATSGSFDAGSSAAVSFAGAFTIQNAASTFTGNLGTGSFTSAPTLTAGTFTVAAAGSTGRWTLLQGATFTSAMTLAFPTDKGELSLSPTKTLTVQGTVTSNVGTASTLPKIDCNGCTSVQGITVAFSNTSTLNINGLEFDNSVSTGVSIANGATYTLLKRLKFLSNVGGGVSTHLLITLGSALINVPGCFFDATAHYNVTLNGTGAGVTPKAIFEYQSAGTNGTLAGEINDLDADTNDDNIADSAAAPQWGSVIEWAGASASDTSGTAVGYPTVAFDWNTFQFYGVYVAYKNTSAGTTDVLWMRHEDGTAAYSYSVPQTSGDLVGTPWWDTINETTAGLDVNGNGNQTDTDVRIVYIGTSTGHIIKLIDDGSSLTAPASGPWATDFTSGGVSTITSPLIEDGTNLYFGGTDGSAAPSMFAVQIVGGGMGEKALARTVATLNAVTATPSWAVYSGTTYVYVGSAVNAGTAYVYRVNMTTGATTGSFSGATASINGSVRLINNHAYAVTEGGTMHVLDASNFNSGGFVNITGFPYQSAAASPIKAAAYTDYNTSYSYFGDNSGKLYVVTDTGANLANYPFTVSGAPQLTSSPVYLPGTGVIAFGAADGCVYFVDRRNLSSAPAIIKRYFVTGAATISSVGYDYNTSRYMVSSSDGKLMFINAADVPDPTSNVE